MGKWDCFQGKVNDQQPKSSGEQADALHPSRLPLSELQNHEWPIEGSKELWKIVFADIYM